MDRADRKSRAIVQAKKAWRMAKLGFLAPEKMASRFRFTLKFNRILFKL
jgi:hypothetical protein